MENRTFPQCLSSQQWALSNTIDLRISAYHSLFSLSFEKSVPEQLGLLPTYTLSGTVNIPFFLRADKAI